MADQPKEKKVRSAAQAAANQRAREAAAEKITWLKSKGLPTSIVYQAILKRGLNSRNKSKSTYNAGKEMNNNAIEASVRARMAENAAKPKVAKAKTAAAASASNNGTRNNKPKGNNGNGGTKKAAKPKTAAMAARNEKAKARMQEIVGKFAEAGIRYGSNSLKYYAEQKKLARPDEEIIADMAAKFPKVIVNESGQQVKAKGPTRAATAKKAKPTNVVAPAVVLANGSVAKGQWVCDRCRLVANNTRRNNSPKAGNNGRSATNGANAASIFD